MMLQMRTCKNYELLAVGGCATPTAMQDWEYHSPMQYWGEYQGSWSLEELSWEVLRSLVLKDGVLI
mgnify:CR=1 FL=1